MDQNWLLNVLGMKYHPGVSFFMATLLTVAQEKLKKTVASSIFDYVLQESDLLLSLYVKPSLSHSATRNVTTSVL